LVQEVANVHSQIEQRMRKTEVHSPVALLQLLKQVSMRKPFVVIEMSKGMFFDFQSKAKAMAFRAVPFTKVCEINYTRSKVVSFKESFSDTSPVSVITVITSDEMLAAKLPETENACKQNVSTAKCKCSNPFLEIVCMGDRAG